MLTGREGRGKSLLALALTTGLVRGESVAGYKITRSARVLVIDAENHEGEIHRRMAGLGLEPGDEDDLIMWGGVGLDLINPAHLDLAVEAIRESQPDVVVLDSMRSTWSGKENDSEYAGPHLDRLRARLARDTDSAVLLLHHDGKQGGYRGSTAIGAAVDLMFHLEAVEGDPVPERRRIRAGKMRLGAQPPPAWVHLHGEPALGIVVVEPTDPYVEGENPAGHRVRDQLAVRIPRLLEDGIARSRADISRNLGKDPKDRTTGRALDALTAAGTIQRDPETKRYHLPPGGTA